MEPLQVSTLIIIVNSTSHMYSPFASQDAGLKITDLHLMTGLPEYRNGGLLVDYGVLVPKHDDILTDEFDPSAEVIIEWRALTVALLDEIHKVLLERLDLSADVFPLVKVRSFARGVCSSIHATNIGAMSRVLELTVRSLPLIAGV
ncbi:hypothetical protein PINS_up013711 [Pythium insidiosum]|nr:hypothetical protein PINS_up013711 [Pythium insidiosum]